MRTDHPAASATSGAVAALLADALADAETGWSLGSFGALAEFLRDPEEPLAPLSDGRLGGATARGAIALRPLPGLRPVAYETAFSGGWNHAVALCLPADACTMGRRAVVTELGPDAEAVRPGDRGDALFDLGLGLLAVDACVRTGDPETVALLRAGCGRPLLAPGNPIGPRLVGLSPHRVFRARLGRIEVFQPIPPPDGAAPEGPHTHVVPQLLRANRTHAATTPIPAGLVPCASLHPPHPGKDGHGRAIPFLRARHDRFQALLEAWGDPGLLDVKRRILAGGTLSPDDAGRHRAGARRVAQAQAPYLRGHPQHQP